MALGGIVILLIAFGGGYVLGAMDSTKFLIKTAFDVLDIERIGMTELIEQYFKLKGGII